MTDRETGQLESDQFIVDGAYLREQALDAARAFVTPLSGVYHAIIGAKRDVSDDRSEDSLSDRDASHGQAL